MPAICDLAKKFLRSYIERGDSPDEICKSHPAAGDGQVQVLGKLRQVGGGQLAITKFEGKEYFTTFSVVELYREIRQDLEDRDRSKQQRLW